MDISRYRPILILIVFIILIQVVISITNTGYFLNQIIMSVYFCIAILGLSLLMGHAGQISLGHAGFFAIGGYVSAVLTTFNLLPHKDLAIVKLFQWCGILFVRKDIYDNTILSVSPWFACIAAVLITIAIAFLIGIPVLRLKGHYLAMATLGFGVIIHTIANGMKIFGEADGISNVPAFDLLPFLKVSGRTQFRIQNYYIAWFLAIVAIIIAINLIRSRSGRALRAIHGNEEAAKAMGIDTFRYKLYTFVLSAVFASVAGIFLTHYIGGIGPTSITVTKSVRYVAIVAVGGMDSIFGCLFMGLVLNFLSLRGYFGNFEEVVFGVILISIMLFFPDGILKAKGFITFMNFIKERFMKFIARGKKGKAGGYAA